jgi:hypothetical protein
MTDWKDTPDIQVIHLPDASLVLVSACKVFVTKNGIDREISWYWSKARAGFRKGPTNPTWIRPGDTELVVQVTFDTDMYYTMPPQVLLHRAWHLPVQFQGDDDSSSGWVYGWWTHSDNPTARLYRYRTWRGRISLAGLLQSTGVGEIGVCAEADETTVCDQDNDLSEYIPDQMRRIKISLDPKGILSKEDH